MAQMEKGDHKYVIRDNAEDNGAWLDFEILSTDLASICMEDIPFPVHGVVLTLAADSNLTVDRWI